MPIYSHYKLLISIECKLVCYFTANLINHFTSCFLTKLCPSRYGDGECLSPKDENIVVEKLLAYHPRAEDKIGCGLDAIMVSHYYHLLKFLRILATT